MRVLLVEDEASLAETVRRGLVAEGWVVEVAADGVEGLRLGSDHAFDVIVMDIMLPRLNGYQGKSRIIYPNNLILFCGQPGGRQDLAAQGG